MCAMVSFSLQRRMAQPLAKTKSTIRYPLDHLGRIVEAVQNLRIRTPDEHDTRTTPTAGRVSQKPAVVDSVPD